MNAAARLVHQNVIARNLVWTNIMSFKHIAMVLMIFGILLSALSTIYITQVTRDLHAAYQRSRLEQDQLHIQQGQLLLERSTLTMQNRVQQIAERKLGMVVPSYHTTVIVHE